MKTALPLLLIVVFALNACTTLANRRDLYSPAKPKGPYTDNLLKYEMEQRSNPRQVPTKTYSSRVIAH